MIYDKSYHDAIENSVEINSISYLYNHINEINKALNLDIVLCNEEVNEYMYQYYINQSVYYQRKKYNILENLYLNLLLLYYPFCML